ncbi:LacI family DNA-binding transcriptional regulator [Paractinoplanes brasiliensis]|uniref:LacI family transcriptional regulator n=1 Tax=Paractinoplanes brasiliensis TaxID=52695 RepID=A0A4R6K487_9ACTN|nr:LacI family DNA-binding transcriptional regulator [Actinoplanes brasiliensis]TDO42075.1 LacI family transcriptional regulator [Actinoplanes brasiliensis]GID33050.1 LacI family transcriptional regulator [Actinoplanes brasiliensis]
MSRKRPTVEDVAAAAGVSKAAVSRVLNNAPGASTETREHVRRVIARLGYKPDPVARALANGHGDLLDLVVVEDDQDRVGANPFYSRVITGVFRALEETGVQLRLRVVDEAGAAALPARLAGSGSLGVLLVNVPPRLAAEFPARGRPVVSMGRSAPGIASIVPENSGGAHAALRHLYATGRRRIAAVHGPRWSPCAADRRDGYQAAMSEAGLHGVSAHGPFRRETGYELTRLLLARDPRLDAVFVGCDLMATGVMQALAEAGRRIPHDVAVIGFDDGPIAACTVPPMSSVHQPVEQMAETAARAVIDRKPGRAWEQTFPTTLRVRASSG